MGAAASMLITMGFHMGWWCKRGSTPAQTPVHGQTEEAVARPNQNKEGVRPSPSKPVRVTEQTLALKIKEQQWSETPEGDPMFLCCGCEHWRDWDDHGGSFRCRFFNKKMTKKEPFGSWKPIHPNRPCPADNPNEQCEHTLCADCRPELHGVCPCHDTNHMDCVSQEWFKNAKAALERDAPPTNAIGASERIRGIWGQPNPLKRRCCACREHASDTWGTMLECDVPECRCFICEKCSDVWDIKTICDCHVDTSRFLNVPNDIAKRQLRKQIVVAFWKEDEEGSGSCSSGHWSTLKEISEATERQYEHE